jgi:hypothetical protein
MQSPGLRRSQTSSGPSKPTTGYGINPHAIEHEERSPRHHNPRIMLSKR